jgi:hypothetical protein
MNLTPIMASVYSNKSNETAKLSDEIREIPSESFGNELNRRINNVYTTPMIPGVEAGQAVAGNREIDGNRETQNFGNEKIWKNGSVNLPVRCLANDQKTKGMGKDYFCDDIVSETGGLEMRKNADGTVTAIGRDFVSPESGLYYKFMGFTVMKSSNPLVTDNMLTLQKGQQKEVFRAYWNTYTLADMGASMAANRAATNTQAQINELQKNTLMKLSDDS